MFGVSSPEAELTLRRLYEEPIAAGVRVHITDAATAELAKVSANAFLATKISFINASLLDALGYQQLLPTGHYPAPAGTAPAGS